MVSCRDRPYKRLFTDFMAELNRKEYPPLEVIQGAISGKAYRRYSMSSSMLVNKSSIAAHAIKPIKINVGIYPTPAYSPPNNVINLTFNPHVLNLLKQGTVSQLDKKELIRFRNETSPNKIKATIAHELSHWLNDVLHNSHIEKVVDLSAEYNDRSILKLGKEDVNMTHFEIDAQIHGIKTLKQQFSTAQWNKMTIGELMDKYPSLHQIWRDTQKYGNNIVDIWKKLLLKRMAREKLLGKNMKTFPRN